MPTLLLALALVGTAAAAAPDSGLGSLLPATVGDVPARANVVVVGWDREWLLPPRNEVSGSRLCS